MRTKFLSLAALLSLSSAALAFDPRPEPTAPDGTRATIDLPTSQHMRNVGSSLDGLGLCVFTSIQHSAYWQNVRVLDGFREWVRRTQRGGGWPGKVDKLFAQFCKEKGVAVPPYIQHTGGDAEFLELALKTGRMPAVTYDGRDDFYRFQIAHMVSLAHLDAKRAAIIDNNRPGAWVWMTRAEFLSRWRGNSGGWGFVLLDPPPPPHPEGVQVVADCPPGGCALPIAIPADPAPAPDPIGEPPTDRHEWGYFPELKLWGWRLKADPPAVAAVENHGVSTDKIHAHPAYSINGVEVSREAAMSAMGDGLKDDSDRWHLAAVGDEWFRSVVRQHVDKLPADIRAKLHVQTYAPGDWPVSQYKLAPGVTLRKPSADRTAADVGAIPTAEYTADALAALLAREGGPTHKPAPPVPPMPAPVPPGPLVPVPPQPDHTGCILACVLFVAFLLKRKAG
jgi:hypothetical protein